MSAHADIPSAEPDWLPDVYARLRRLASHYLGPAPGSLTLPPTAIVHEAYLKLAHAQALQRDRTVFFATAARAMRQVIVDHLRARRADKRGGHHARVPLHEADGLLAADAHLPIDAAVMSEAIEQLAALSPRQAQVVELRVIGGLTLDEVAAALDVSRRTVIGDWRMAMLWLRRYLQRP